MTVSSTSSRVNYIGDGHATTFAFAFKVNQPADLAVVYTDATGVDYTLSPSQYTATGFGLDAGGAVTYTLPDGSAIAAGTKLTIYRNVAVTQPTSISNQGAMWPQVIEAALDRLTYIAQKVTDSVSRSLVISPTDSASLNVLPNATLRANSVLAFDSQGQPYAGALTGSLVGVSTWAASQFLSADSAATARSRLYAVGYTLVGSTQTVDLTAGQLQVRTHDAGENTTDAASTAFVTTAVTNAQAAGFGGITLRSYLAGLGMSNDTGAPNTTIDVAKGVCADDTNARMLSWLGGTSLNCANNGINGLDAGSLSSNAWYHVHVIGQVGGPAALLACSSATLSAGTIAMPTGYTLKRRIGSFKTDGSSHILPFIQAGDDFWWSTPVLDVNDTNPGSARQTKTLNSVPDNIAVTAILNVMPTFASSALQLYIHPFAVADLAASQTASPLGIAGSTAAGGGLTTGVQARILTNGSAQIAYRTSATTGAGDVIRMATVGWIDRRGRDD